MVCSAFSTRKEEIIVTLCGAPDWQVLLWDWEKCRLLSTCSLGLNISATIKPRTFQISFNQFDLTEASSMLLTGPCNTFKYLKKDADNNLFTEHTQINNMH
jgi:hypothetical protein